MFNARLSALLQRTASCFPPNVYTLLSVQTPSKSLMIILIGLAFVARLVMFLVRCLSTSSPVRGVVDINRSLFGHPEDPYFSTRRLR